MRLLLIEDDPASQKFLAIGLRQQSFAVDTASSAFEAELSADENPYAVYIVDIGLPEGTTAGLEFVRQRRAKKDFTPVLFLSARGELDDRVDGLGIGDDYLVKPAHLREVVARVEALCRRQRSTPANVLKRGDLEIDWTARAVSLAGEPVHLTAKEYGILELLAANPGRLYSQAEIISRVWDEQFDYDSNVIAVYAKRLRGKLGHGVIETVVGVGYRFPAA
jgi:DNA-binding response OmpR family regulator